MIKVIENKNGDVGGYDMCYDDAENLGKKILLIFILIDVKRRIKEKIVFVTKAKTTTLNVNLKPTLLNKPFKC